MGLAYYNDNDPSAVAWLKELMSAGLIAPGDVDGRDVWDVTPTDIAPYRQCHFFAGLGAWSYALREAGWPDGRHVWTGSPPCQPFSEAGARGGITDKRHLWPAWHWLIGQSEPGVIFGEQVSSRSGLAWLDIVHSDLEGAGYAIGALDLCAAGMGAPHLRQRLYFVAESDLGRGSAHSGLADSKHDDGRAEESRRGPQGRIANGRAGPVGGFWGEADWFPCGDGKWRPVESSTLPLAHGPVANVGRLRGYGNTIVVPLAVSFIKAYMEER